jgi:hypothetical protein
MLALVVAVLGDATLVAAADARLPRNWRFTLPAGTAATSWMEDDNDLLTIRELVDLVEFHKGIR